MRALALLLTCTGLLMATDSHAHGGGLNSEGCHNNRKTGDYHCHRNPAASTPRQDYQPRNPNGAPRHDLDLSGQPAPTRAFRNCSEARAAGAAPVRRGDPGYGSHLDRDNDGVGCE